MVDEGKRGDSRDKDVEISEEEDSASRLGLREGDDVADAITDRGNDVVEEIDVIEYRDEEVAEAVVEVVEAVVEVVEAVVKVVEAVVEAFVDNNKEVFSEFKDSGDEDYTESSEDIVSDSEGGLSEVDVDRSNDEDYEESSGVIDNNEEERIERG
jgi:hypothetical protein